LFIDGIGGLAGRKLIIKWIQFMDGSHGNGRFEGVWKCALFANIFEGEVL
jgi:hypothetical protein